MGREVCESGYKGLAEVSEGDGGGVEGDSYPADKGVVLAGLPNKRRVGGRGTCCQCTRKPV